MILERVILDNQFWERYREKRGVGFKLGPAILLVPLAGPNSNPVN